MKPIVKGSGLPVEMMRVAKDALHLFDEGKE